MDLRHFILLLTTTLGSCNLYGDREPDPLPGRDDLVVGLQVELEVVEAAGDQRLALRERRVVLRVRPAARDDVGVRRTAFCPRQGHDPDRQVGRGLVRSQADREELRAGDVNGGDQLRRRVEQAVLR